MLIAVAYVPDKDNATTAEFDRAAQYNAKTFWIWAVQAAFVWWGASLWWATIPAIHVVYSAVAWVSCRRAARLRREAFALAFRRCYYEALRGRPLSPFELRHQSSKADNHWSRELPDVRSRRTPLRDAA